MDSLPNRPSPSRPISELVVAWLHWFGVIRLVVTVVAVLAVVAGGFWLLRAPATPVESTLPYAVATTAAVPVVVSAELAMDPATSADASSAAADTAPSSPATIFVYVAGAVIVPGVYELTGGARVQQAVVAAGGAAADADVDAVNLAAFVADGDRVFIPRVGQAVPTVVAPTSGGSPGGSPPKTATSGPTGPVDLNDATADQLDALPGIGPSTAAAIVAHRDANGPFASVDALLDVRGIGPAKLEAIRALITV